MDTSNRYADRLEAASYADDVQCQIQLVRDPSDVRSEPIESWIAERLLARLKHLAAAYELPLLARLPTQEVQIYPEIQVEGLEDELAFLFSVISDDVLLNAIAPLRQMIGVVMRDPRGWFLRVEGP